MAEWAELLEYINPKILAQPELTKMVLMTGDKECCKIFLYEMAVSCAKEGQRVFYFASKKMQSLLPSFHGRNEPSADALKRITFLYTPTYDALAEQLLHVVQFSDPPSVILLDDLDYFSSQPQGLPCSIVAARICALLLRAASFSSEVLKIGARVCATSYCPETFADVYYKYFDGHWTVDIKRDPQNLDTVCLKSKSKGNEAVCVNCFRLRDATLVLNKMLVSDV